MYLIVAFEMYIAARSLNNRFSDVSRVARRPVFHRPSRYFTANLAEAGTKSVFWKSVPEAGILKINALE